MDLPKKSKIFLDTNILIYLKFSNLPFHSETASVFSKLMNNQNSFCISTQVLREYISSCTRENFHLNYEDVLSDCTDFTNYFELFEDSKEIAKNLFEICKKYKIKGKQVHDANIVATMKINQIQYILTANINHFKRFMDEIEIISIN